MFGWKRVAVTIGEKIGKKGMTYAQGVSAQVTAAVSIGVASYTGMPVSTTQVLSSAVAGTMIVDGGGVQTKTIKNIMLAWILTLPVSIILSGVLYWISCRLSDSRLLSSETEKPDTCVRLFASGNRLRPDNHHQQRGNHNSAYRTDHGELTADTFAA